MSPEANSRSLSSGFMGDDFLLSTPIASQLFHDVAATMPIVDVHNHLSSLDIAQDRVWETISDLWLADDHYKWRAMRLAGVREELITGQPDPWEQFQAWAETVPRLIRNPLYVWTHLELKRIFDIDLVLSPATAKEIWDEANRQLPERSAQQMLAAFDVEVVATTDEPSDLLADHKQLAQQESNGLSVVPTFRPDAGHSLLGDPAAWNAWVDRLVVSGDAASITDLASLLDALTSAYGRFSAVGCRASDHGLAYIPDRPRDEKLADLVIRQAREGRSASEEDSEVVLLEIVALAARLAVKEGAVMQIHLGALRNVSPRLMGLVGRDAGSDVMGDERHALGLARFLGDLEAAGELPRTVIYNLNPADNAMMVTMAGAFARPGIAGLVQWGPGWWFNDHEVGMRKHLDELSAIGQLGGFIGMLTDSRSIASMTRHELFRRILCDALGRDVASGLVSNDLEPLAQIVRDISVSNARDFFGFSQP